MSVEFNSRSVWDQIWSKETEGGLESWRQYPDQFGRIRWLLKEATRETQPGQTPVIVDIGCGAGVLLSSLKADLCTQCPDARYVGVDISPVAVDHARNKGIEAQPLDVETATDLPRGDILLCTEFLEHATDDTVRKILAHSTGFAKSFFMVPNFCLGPEQEKQHLRKWSAKEFRNLLLEYHPSARVEVFYDQQLFRVHGHRGYLLGVCGYERSYRLSFTMPVKNEEQDVERVLASFRGAADEIVIGIDDTTTDRTEEIVNLYADKVFKFTWEKDFSKARNACIDCCTGDWIFMSEGHEHLHRGLQALLQLDEIPSFVNVLEVRREAQQNIWYFPWLFRRISTADGTSRIRFKNAVHNVLDGFDDDKESAKAHQISTWHERSLAKDFERTKQRQGMNKREFLRRIREENNIRDMYYLGVEYRDEICSRCHGHGTWKAGHPEDTALPCPDCAVETPSGELVSTGIRPIAWRQSIYWFENFLAAARPSPLRYQGRLSLAKMYVITKRWTDAKRTLIAATMDDVTRIEHWYMLGEICEGLGQLDLAMRFYEYSSLGINRPPVSAMFLDKAMYTFLPAQKLASVYAQLELYDEALSWAKRVSDLLPEWAPPEAHKECAENIRIIEELIHVPDQQEQQL